MIKHLNRRRSLFGSTLLLSSTFLGRAAFAQEAAPPATEAAPPAAEAPAAVAPAPVETTPAPAEPAAPSASLEATTSEPTPAVAEPPAADKPKPPPYSLPFQLRPAGPVTVIRSDTSLAFFENPTTGKSGTTLVSTLLGSYKIVDEFSPLVRLGVVSNSPPDAPAPAPDNAFGFLNPVIGGTYGPKLGPNMKLGIFLGVTIPVGSGGGNEPDLDNAAANNPFGIRARSAMDNAMFAVNDFTIFPGVGFAYLAHGFTAQVEATVLQLMRVRGEDVQKDEQKTNFTSGVHVGYFFLPVFSLGAELRYQRWLSTPKAVEADENLEDPTGIRDTMTAAIGPRFHFKIGEKTWIRPAVSLSVPLDDPMQDWKYKIVQLDIPVVF